ncbi:MAG: hypothetical protein NTX05_00100 [Fusobacteria bacterium]|nr:hypothetical protein [Fusobacteriota bacterium]
MLKVYGVQSYKDGMCLDICNNCGCRGQCNQCIPNCNPYNTCTGQCQTQTCTAQMCPTQTCTTQSCATH